MKKNPIQNFVPKRYSVINSELDNLKLTEVYAKLIEKLEIDLKDAGDNVLRELIGSAPNDYRLAGYCYAIAKEDNQKILDAYDKFLGKHEKSAQAAIMKLKQDKEWAGTTSKDTIRAWIAENVPASSVWFETLRKSERALKVCQILHESYKNRLSSLQTYAKLVERRRGVSIEEFNEKHNIK